MTRKKPRRESPGKRVASRRSKIPVGRKVDLNRLNARVFGV